MEVHAFFNIVRCWSDANSTGAKFGPISVCRYLLDGAPCWFVGVLNRWTLLDTGRKRLLRSHTPGTWP